MLSTTSRLNSLADSASAQAASTASSPASATAVRMSTNWRSPSSCPASRRRVCKYVSRFTQRRRFIAAVSNSQAATPDHSWGHAKLYDLGEGSRLARREGGGSVVGQHDVFSLGRLAESRC